MSRDESIFPISNSVSRHTGSPVTKRVDQCHEVSSTNAFHTGVWVAHQSGEPKQGGARIGGLEVVVVGVVAREVDAKRGGFLFQANLMW